MVKSGLYVGRFNEIQIKNREDKKEIEKTRLKAKENGLILNYTNSKIIYKNKQPVAIDIWICNAEDFKI